MDILAKAVIGGVVTGIILLIAKHLGPRVAGIFAGIPLVFAISYILLTYETQDSAQIYAYINGGVWGGLAFFVFAAGIYGLTQYSPGTYWLNFVVSYGACIGAAAFIALR